MSLYRSLLFIALALVALAPARADFQVAFSTFVEDRSAVAHNPADGSFIVAYLTDSGPQRVVATRRFSADGTPLGGESFPFGIGTHLASDRPAIVFNAAIGRYLVAVPERLTTNNRILARQLNADGTTTPQTVVFPFDTLGGDQYDGIDVSSMDAAANPSVGNFLVTYQLTIGGFNQLWAQVVEANGTLGLPRQVADLGLNGLNGHGLAFAPQHGGRYLVACHSGGILLKVLDANGVPILIAGTGPSGLPNFDRIPFTFGEPAGASSHAQPDVAYGRVQGKDRWLVVWSDRNNCRPGITECASDPFNQWSGVWGSYVDPAVTYYQTDAPAQNTPFPISKIWTHLGNQYTYTPRVTHSPQAQSFLVSWREVPFDDPNNDESRSHVRLGRIDYFVADGLANSQQVPLPVDNAVISDVSGTCTPGQLCYSAEDPRRPSIVGNNDQGAVVVWDQQYPPNPTDHDVMGDIYRLPAPVNDLSSQPTPIPGGGRVALAGTLIGASLDVVPSCSVPDGWPVDVWYSYTAPAAGTLTVTTCGTNDLYGTDLNTDTVLSLHDLASFGELPNGCNDDWISSPVSCAGLDQGNPRDSGVNALLAPGQQVAIRVGSYPYSPAGPFQLDAQFAFAGAGSSAGLSLDKRAGGGLHLEWQPSCDAADGDYMVYAGLIGSFNNHQAVSCGTGGATQLDFAPLGMDEYFLVVPAQTGVEGSYGRDSFGAERGVGAIGCREVQATSCG